MNTSFDRLRFVYELGNAFAAYTELNDLLPVVLTKCCAALEEQWVAVLLLDRERNELYFPYVSEDDPKAAARLSAIRFPAQRGIAGAVLRSGISEKIDDVQSDPRWYSEVDRRSSYITKSLL